MIQVVIHVSGGVVQSVESSEPNAIDVILCDQDNEQAGDPEAITYPASLIDCEELHRLWDIAHNGAQLS